MTGTRRAPASPGWLLPVAACPAVLACLLAACGSQPAATTGARSAGDTVASPAAVRTSDPATASPAPSPQPTAAAKPLAGITVGIDPGHNGLNGTDPSFINHLIWNGRENETCDTTGTQTAGGYTEARYNFNVARYLRAALRADGAHVVMTRQNNDGAGPCVDRRAQILNHSGARVSIDIHADGGPAWGRGFTVLEPVADGPNDQVIGSSERFGADVRAALLAHTSMPESDYYGSHGIEFRNDLAGLNLTTEPKVLIESGNMVNATDAALLTSPRFQRQFAAALLAAILTFLHK
ncbi:MAG TPA: N-acetylmuramoyl-L-alanine amidase [Streptosporangiaceae bacterium]|nr:N-acetylmuramoyl-L-alanine amidase [Streptosporangiaceae bacterium]